MKLSVLLISLLILLSSPSLVADQKEKKNHSTPSSAHQDHEHQSEAHKHSHNHSHDHHHHHGRITEWLNKHVFLGDLGELYRSGHEIIEHHPGRFYDLKQLALTAVRWKNLHQNSPWIEHVENFSFLFAISHSTEVMTIPASLIYCVSQAVISLVTQAPMPWDTCGTYFAGSLVIANPGTDPLCWSVFIPYFLPKINKYYQPAVTRVRKWTIKHINSLLLERTPRLDILLKEFELSHSITDDFGNTIHLVKVPLSPELYVTANLKQNDKGVVELDSLDSSNSEDLGMDLESSKAASHLLDWNSESTLNMLSQNLNSHMVTDDYGDTIIIMAVPISAKVHITLTLKHSQKGKVYLDALSIPNSEIKNIDLKELKTRLSVFDWNSKHAIETMINSLQEDNLDFIERQMYTKDIYRNESLTRVTFKPLAITMGDQIRLSPSKLGQKISQACTQLLAKVTNKF